MPTPYVAPTPNPNPLPNPLPTPYAAAASDQPQDVMSVLQAIERGEISVAQGLELMRKLG